MTQMTAGPRVSEIVAWALGQAAWVKLQGRKLRASSSSGTLCSGPDKSFLQRTPPTSPRTFHPEPGATRKRPAGPAGKDGHLLPSHL